MKLSTLERFSRDMEAVTRACKLVVPNVIPSPSSVFVLVEVAAKDEIDAARTHYVYEDADGADHYLQEATRDQLDMQISVYANSDQLVFVHVDAFAPAPGPLPPPARAGGGAGAGGGAAGGGAGGGAAERKAAVTAARAEVVRRFSAHEYGSPGGADCFGKACGVDGCPSYFHSKTQHAGVAYEAVAAAAATSAASAGSKRQRGPG
jgi:hypothetical protein